MLNYIFDPSFVLDPSIKLKNNFNNSGRQCIGCRGFEKCELLRRSVPYFCFAGFKRHIDPSNFRNEGAEFYTIDCILNYHDTFRDPEKQPMSEIERRDFITDMSVNEDRLDLESQAIYRCLAKQVVNILYSRGYTL